MPEDGPKSQVKTTDVLFTVKDADGLPGVDLPITLTYAENRQDARTSVKGRAVFKNIPVGRQVNVSVELPDGTLFRDTYECWPDQKAFVLEMKDQSFQPKVRLRLKVVDTAGRPGAMLPVSLFYGENRMDKLTQSDGRVWFPDVPLDARVKIKVYPPDSEPTASEFTVDGSEAVREIVMSPDGSPQTGTLVFRVTDQKGEPLPDIRLSLDVAGTQRLLTTSGKGTATFGEIPVGTVVKLEARGRRFWQKFNGTFTCGDKITEECIVLKKPSFPKWWAAAILGTAILGIAVFLGLRRFGPNPRPSSPSPFPGSAAVAVVGKPFAERPLKGASGEVRVNLKWSGCADLDVHIIDPCGGEVRYDQLRLSCKGLPGVLDVDANGKEPYDCLNPQENVYWTNAPPGRYRVYAEYFSKRNGSGPTPYLFTIFNRFDKKEYRGVVNRQGDRTQAIVFEVQD